MSRQRALSCSVGIAIGSAKSIKFLDPITESHWVRYTITITINNFTPVLGPERPIGRIGLLCPNVETLFDEPSKSRLILT